MGVEEPDGIDARHANDVGQGEVRIESRHVFMQHCLVVQDGSTNNTIIGGHLW